MSAPMTDKGGTGLAPSRLRQAVRLREGGLAVLMILVSLAAAASLPAFRSSENISEVLNNSTIVIVLAIGETLVLLTRQIDLSVGATLGLSAFIMGSLVGHMGALSVPGAVALSLLVGAVLGLGNGLLVDLARMPAIIATLATLAIYSGLQVIISGGSQVYASQLPSWLANLYVTNWLGAPSFIVIAVVCVVVFGLIMRFTRWGRDLYAMGSNPEAARYMAIPTRRRTYEAFIVCGALAGFGGLLYAAQYGNVDATAGGGFNLQVIAGAVVGGVSLFGGSGTPVGAALGSLFLVEIENILALLKISIFAQQTLQGVAIVAAVVIYALLTRRLQHPASRTQYVETAGPAGSVGPPPDADPAPGMAAG